MTANEHAVHKQQAIEDYRRALTEEGKLNTDRLRLGAALTTGQHYVDAKGGLHPFNRNEGDPKAQTPEQITAMKDDMRQRYDESTTQLQSIIAQKNDAIERAGGHPSVSTDEAIAKLRAGHVHNMNAALNKPEPPAQPTAPAAPAKPKVTDLGTIKAFAAKVNMPLAQAIKQAQAEGYQVKGAQ
jgi:hypothetical protein